MTSSTKEKSSVLEVVSESECLDSTDSEYISNDINEWLGWDV